MKNLHKPKRQPIPFTAVDGGECLRVPLASGHGPATIDADDLSVVLAAGVTLAWSFNDNGSGRRYVRACRAGGNTVMVARLIMDAGPGHEVHYRDGDPSNLRRENLFLTGRQGQPLVAAENEGEAKGLPQISARASNSKGRRESPLWGPRATQPADATAIRGQA